MKEESRRRKTNPWGFALELGFFAGIIWGAMHWLMFALKFTQVIPGYLGEPFLKHDFVVSGAGALTGYLLFIVLSVLATLLYVLLLRKLKGPWPGMIYGLVWFAGLILAGAPLFLRQRPFRLSWDSLISEACLFLLWGLFIGYTTAMEFTDERKREQKSRLA